MTLIDLDSKLADLSIKTPIFQGEGFNCRTNRTNGDGSWSRYSIAKLGLRNSLSFSETKMTCFKSLSVAAQRKWIENQLQPGGATGNFHQKLKFTISGIHLAT